jgi:predicted nucleotidyltransferase
LDRITAIEDEYSVEIIYAVESGSRAWGFESPDSDYDVRFIYKHDIDWYISVFPGRDFLEFPVDDLLDFSGWDIKKALFLLNKSNPVLFEWLNSPIVYKINQKYFSRLQSVADLYFSPISCLYHYLHMAKGNYREYLQADMVRLKKYLYVLRPLFACAWIEKNKNPPPMNFENLLNGLNIKEPVISEVNKLLELKKKGFESSTAPKMKIINEFIEERIEYFSQTAADFNPAAKPSSDVLDVLFRELLKEE